MRVETFWNTCTTATVSFNNSGNVLAREWYGDLLPPAADAGCIDIPVYTVALAKDRNMKIVLEINLGAEIPVAWLGFNYTGTLCSHCYLDTL